MVNMYLLVGRNSLGRGNLKLNDTPLAGVAQWIERPPVNQRVAGSISSRGPCLDCGPGPHRGWVGGNHTLIFLSLFLPSSLSKNK